MDSRAPGVAICFLRDPLCRCRVAAAPTFLVNTAGEAWIRCPRTLISWSRTRKFRWAGVPRSSDACRSASAAITVAACAPIRAPRGLRFGNWCRSNSTAACRRSGMWSDPRLATHDHCSTRLPCDCRASPWPLPIDCSCRRACSNSKGSRSALHQTSQPMPCMHWGRQRSISRDPLIEVTVATNTPVCSARTGRHDWRDTPSSSRALTAPLRGLVSGSVRGVAMSRQRGQSLVEFAGGSAALLLLLLGVITLSGYQEVQRRGSIAARQLRIRVSLAVARLLHRSVCTSHVPAEFRRRGPAGCGWQGALRHWRTMCRLSRQRGAAPGLAGDAATLLLTPLAASRPFTGGRSDLEAGRVCQR